MRMCDSPGCVSWVGNDKEFCPLHEVNKKEDYDCTECIECGKCIERCECFDREKYNIDALMKHFSMKWQWGDDHKSDFDESSKEFNNAVYVTLRDMDIQRLKLLAFKQKVKEIVKEAQE